MFGLIIIGVFLHGFIFLNSITVKSSLEFKAYYRLKVVIFLSILLHMPKTFSLMS